MNLTIIRKCPGEAVGANANNGVFAVEGGKMLCEAMQLTPERLWHVA